MDPAQAINYNSPQQRASSKLWEYSSSATASLDLKQAQTVMRILRAAADGGIGVVVVIHDIALVRRYGDTAFLLQDGGVAYAGEPKIVLTAERIVDAFDIDFETAEGSISF